MQHPRLPALVLTLLAAPAGWADLTVRHTLEVKFGPGFPPAVADAIAQQAGANIPKEMIVRVKGRKCFSTAGLISGITDTSTGQLTLLNPLTKQFAVTSSSGFASQAISQAQLPDTARQTLENLNLDVQTRKTGQTAAIQGIQAEESLTTLIMEIPNAGGPPMGLRMEIRNWRAVPEELNRIPALQERAACSSSALDMSDALQKMLAQLPDKFRGAIQELMSSSGGLALKTQVGVYIPALMILLQSQGQNAQGFDPNAALIEINLNLAELSTDPLPDALFQPPPDYRQAPPADLIRAMTGAPPRPPVQLQPPAVAVAPSPVPPGAVRVGNGVSAPAVLSQVQPQYTEEARRGKVQGTVLLSVVVNANGDPEDIQLVRPLGAGLDEKAVEAVRQWKFQPGQKGGVPVNVIANIEVNFRLLDPP